MNADSIRIEEDEDGFSMVVMTHDNLTGSTPKPGWYVFHITDPEALYDHVKATIGPWLYERDMARGADRIRARHLSDDDFEAYVNDAYADDWPKAEGMRQMREKRYC